MSSETAPSAGGGDLPDVTRTLDIPGAASGASIGPYQLGNQIGEGGMGVVFHARQLHPIRRDVALKIIKPGMDSRQVISRFESERQALAIMDHPNIARVFDAGTTSAGLPYFVMELVEGAKITSYCNSRRLTLKERIELFIQVCQAIQHAHQKGIIHRDIKPSNILVTEQDGKPAPKVIDFGLAKALGPQTGDVTQMTNVGTVVGTLDYMSPEQAATTRRDVDTRSDVYSLGAVLYELFTGSTPLGREGLPEEGYLAALQRIRQEETPPPSARLRRSPSSSEIAVERRIDPVKLQRLLRGELDWIVMKAIEKDPSRRYSASSDLAADLGRFLRNEPVLACPPSATYRTWKFARRHRFGAAVAMSAILLLVAFSLTMAIQAQRVARERDRALVAEKTATQVSSFLVSLFRVSDPNRTAGTTLTAREILDRGAAQVRTDLAGQPLAQARLMDTLGRVYDGLGLYEQAQPLLESALATRLKLLGRENLEVAGSLEANGDLWLHKGEYGKAKPITERALAIREKLLGPDDREIALTLGKLVNIDLQMATIDEAEKTAQRELTIYEKQLPPVDLDIASAASSLGGIAYRKGNNGRARQLWQRALALREGALPPDHPLLAQTLNNLAAERNDSGDAAGAVPLLERAVRIQEKALGLKHVDLAFSLSNLGSALLATNEDARARQSYQRALDIYGAVAPQHPEAGVPLVGMARLERKEGRLHRSAALFEQALAAWRRSDGSYYPRVAYYLTEYIELLRGLGQSARAAELEAVAQSLNLHPK